MRWVASETDGTELPARPALMRTGRCWLIAWAFVAATFGLALTGTTTALAAAYTYAAPTIACVDVRASGVAEAGSARLSDPGEVSASPSVEGRGTSTTSLDAVNATNTAGLVDDASFAANTRAKIRDHVFVDKHKLQPLVSKLGSEEAVIKKMLNGVQTSLPKSGFFEIPVQIGGQTVIVRGAVVNGVTRISTAFTP